MDVRKSNPAAPSPADAGPRSWVAAAPAGLRPFLQLSRFDRPVGFWLLALPCPIGLFYARIGAGLHWGDAGLVALFALGAVAMRGAGCTYNDILDRDIDRRVARTAGRPLASGAIGLKAAWLWLLAQCSVGLLVLLQLPILAQMVALGSIPLVALYPLMKRITWWPQAWLGLTFNWGAPVAAAAIRGFVSVGDLLAYAGLVLWTIGYDTIYALQDREDDAMIGVRSTARLFGRNVRRAVAAIYALSATLAIAAGWLAAGAPGTLATLPFAAHLAQQAARVSDNAPQRALHLFRTNRDAGLLLAAGWAFIAGLS